MMTPEQAAANRRHYLRVKTAVFDHYGTTCACCGSSRSLAIDHVNGDGQEHRTGDYGISYSSKAMYAWLIKNGFPEGFQTLCRPCNSSKGKGLRCRIDHTAVDASHLDGCTERPLTVRMPSDLKAWYRQHAADAGERLNTVLVTALEEYRECHDSNVPAEAARG
jgi:hypothetical protein